MRTTDERRHRPKEIASPPARVRPRIALFSRSNSTGTVPPYGLLTVSVESTVSGTLPAFARALPKLDPQFTRASPPFTCTAMNGFTATFSLADVQQRADGSASCGTTWSGDRRPPPITLYSRPMRRTTGSFIRQTRRSTRHLPSRGRPGRSWSSVRRFWKRARNANPRR